MTEAYALARKLSYGLLEMLAPGHVDGADIGVQVEAACDLVEKQMGVSLSSVERSRLKREIETDIPQRVDKPRVIQDKKHREWLEDREPEWAFWKRYRDYMEGRVPPGSLDALEDSTRLVLGLLEDPERDGCWDRRGLVVGQVQSGKTGHYTGLINRACDAGYKLVVVLAGMHNSLRSQTQIRLDEGFLGWESGAEEGRPPIGVGRGKRTLHADTITNRLDRGDFKKSVAESLRVSIGKVPLLFVVKKNVTVLNHLVKWMRTLDTAHDPETGRVYVPNIPLLVIDDESDQASIDTKKGPVDAYGNPDPDHDPTKTNSLIRQLLHTFDKSAYVGYTATPFANIFIHDKAETTEEGPDLFPRSFIIGLEAPPNYMGPAKVFGLSSDESSSFDEVRPLPLTRRNDEAQTWVPSNHKPAHVPRYSEDSELPPSLESAILSFFLSGAARAARGQADEHQSMLIHVTRFVEVQRHIRGQVRTYVTQVRRLLNRGGGSTDTVLRRLKELWDEDFAVTTPLVIERLGYEDKQLAPLVWDEIEPHLLGFINSVQVYEVNGSATDALEYEKHREHGLKVIAVGGDKLSRGLTLEGLTTSYFLRTSRMYDTLMQMGRWFGYRPGYADVCRLYLPKDLEDAFIHITEANEELHREFAIMEGVKATPEDYGLKVLSHPTLLVTSPNKMRASDIDRISFGGTLAQTVVFHADREHTHGNLVALEDLLKTLGAPNERNTKSKSGRPLTSPGNAVWDGVSAAEVVRFLGAYRTHTDAAKIRSDRLASYISRQTALNELTSWTVALISNTTATSVKVAGHDVGLTVRETGGGRFGNGLAIRALVSPGDESIGMTEEEIADATELARRRLRKPDATPGGIDLRNARSAERGLLLVYPLDPTRVGGRDIPGHNHENDRTEDTSHPLVGFAVSFPGSKNTPARDYLVNQIHRRREKEDD